MNETKRLTELFKDMYDGETWLDVNLTSVLKPFNAAQAAKKLMPNCNSIWEVANHIIDWRLNVLERVNGAVIKTPEHNYFIAIEDASEQAWNDTLIKLEDSQNKWLEFLNTFDEASYDNIYPVNNMSFYKHVHGIIQHDAYHLGQTMLLAKLQRLQNAENFV